MLGKLLKHEFRATGRIMLPIYGETLILVLLDNTSIRLLDCGVGVILKVLSIFSVTVFIVAIIAAAIMTLLLMVKRFTEIICVKKAI